MIDWTTAIEDQTKRSKIWKVRGKESQGGCYICGSTENITEYAFGRLHIETVGQQITTDMQLSGTKRYSYAPPVRRYLCEDCLRWEYQHHINLQSSGVFIFFGLICLVLGIVFAVNGGFTKGSGWMVFTILLFVGFILFSLAACQNMRTRKEFTQDDGDKALAVIFTGVSSNDLHNCGYYIRSEKGKTPNDPLLR